jgi:hypothetical protein
MQLTCDIPPPDDNNDSNDNNDKCRDTPSRDRIQNAAYMCACAGYATVLSMGLYWAVIKGAGRRPDLDTFCSGIVIGNAAIAILATVLFYLRGWQLKRRSRSNNR